MIPDLAQWQSELSSAYWVLSVLMTVLWCLDKSSREVVLYVHMMVMMRSVMTLMESFLRTNI